MDTNESRAQRTSRFLRRTEEYQKVELKTRKGIDDKFLQDYNTKLTNYGCIIFDEKLQKYRLVNTRPAIKDEKLKVAEVYFKKQRFTKGWDKLSVYSYKQFANAFLQSYFAGYLEGRITAADINSYISIKREGGNGVDERNYSWKPIFQFFERIDANLIKKIKTLNNITDTNLQLKWMQILLGYAQIKGMLSGYNYEQQRDSKLDAIKITNLLLLQADGELPELKRAFSYLRANKEFRLQDKSYFKDAFNIDTQDPAVFWNQLMKQGKCSAFIKLLKDEQGNHKDLMVGHTTWGEDVELIRTYKYNSFQFEDNAELPSVSLTFSSYPGTLSSTDDYYITSNKIVVTETTIEVIDVNLYKFMKNSEQYIPNYLRVIAATRFAKSAEEWVNHFETFNSGSYSSQWLILDYNIFEKIKGTNQKPDKLFYVSEQTPNKFVSHDVSQHLYTNSFFGGYNRAFFDESNTNLNKAMIKYLYGDVLSEHNASKRGNQFKHLQKGVTGLKSMMGTMRYNGYRQGHSGDKSSDFPSAAISARYDLNYGQMGGFIGGIDAKISNSELVKDLIAITVNGPTSNVVNPQITNYKLRKKYSRMLGIPEEINWPYIKIDPKDMYFSDIDDLYTFDQNEKYDDWEDDRK